MSSPGDRLPSSIKGAETIKDPAQILSVLGSPQFDVFDYAARYTQLAKALKLDFSAILRTLRFVPACAAAEQHAPLRREIGELIANRQTLVRNMAPLIAAQCLAPLGQDGEHDLIASALVPYVGKTLRILSGITMSETAVDHPLLSGLFSQGAGIARRRRLNAQLGEIWRWLDTMRGHEPEQLRGVRLALLVLGFDATVGTLASSLHAALPSGRTALSALALADAPTHTGVPYIDRMATDQSSGPEGGWQAGDVARLRLDVFEAGNPGDDSRRLFGSGAHTCLGRAIATSLWRTLADTLRQLPGDIEVVELTWARNDVFRVPETFKVRITHG